MDPVSRQTLGALLGLGVVGVLLCTLLVLSGPWPAPTPTPTVPPVVLTPETVSPTVTTIPQVITPTVTNTPHVAPTVEVVTPNVRTPTPNVPETGTPAQDSKTPTVSPSGETPVVVDKCRQGVITAHAAIDQVLANKPDRRCDGCTYYASVMCQDIDKDLSLRIGIRLIQVRVVDCATWAVGTWPQKQGENWLGELDIRSWPGDAPLAPLEAELCED